MEYIKDVARIELDQDKCTGCGFCIEVCPHNVIEINNRLAYLTNKDRCIECGACSMNCPTGAIDVETGVGCAHAILKIWLAEIKGLLNIDSNKDKDSDGSGCC